MLKFTRIEAIAAPLLRPNIDTDLIISGDHMMKVSSSGFGGGLFANWRYRTGPDGPARDSAGELVPDPDFVLNRRPFDRAQILLAGVNFACGSSREHAVWALRDWGIRAVIAPSFGNIFYANCFKNGVLPIVLAEETIERIADCVMVDPERRLVTVDLEARLVSTSELSAPFEIGEFYRLVLLEGLDAVQAIGRYTPDIDRYESDDAAQRPWIYGIAGGEEREVRPA